MTARRFAELAAIAGEVLARPTTDTVLDRALCAAIAPLTSFASAGLASLEGDGYFRVTHVAGRLTSARELREIALARSDLDRLVAVARRVGSLHVVDGDHPLLDELLAKAAIRETESLVEGWNPATLTFELVESWEQEVGAILFLDQPVSLGGLDEEEVGYLDALAQLVGLALVQEHLRSRVSAQVRILEAERARLAGLLAASGDVQRRTALLEVLQTAADAVTTAGGFARAAIYLREGDSLVLAVTSGVDPVEAERLHAAGPIPLSLFAAVMAPQMRISRSYLFRHRAYPLHPDLARRMSVPVAEHVADDDAWQPEDTLSIPLLEDERLLGVISVDNPVDGRYPDLGQIQALEFFADQAAIAVGQVRATEELRRYAETDALTALANRRTFEASGAQALHDAQVEGRAVAVVFVDLDHFKALNDEYGHLAGDLALRASAEALRSCVRARDLVARWGGEEFVALVTDVELEWARQLGEAIRASIATSVRAEVGVEASASVGVAVAESTEMDAPDLRALLAAADVALYLAKQRGRDRSEVVVRRQDGTVRHVP